MANLLVGCASQEPLPPMVAAGDLRPAPASVGAAPGYTNLIRTTTQAVERMADSLPAPLLGSLTLVTTVTDVNRISMSAPLGRTLSEHVATAWVGRGFKVREVRMRDHLLLDESQGEMMLSRTTSEVAATQDAELVITGTYSSAANVTYVSLKVLRASNAFVEAAVSYELPNSPDVRKLLQKPTR